MSNDFRNDENENNVLHVEKEETIQTQDGGFDSGVNRDEHVGNDSYNEDGLDKEPDVVKEVHHEEVHNTTDGDDDVTVNGVDFDRVDTRDGVDTDVRHDVDGHSDDRSFGDKIKDKVEDVKDNMKHDH